MTTDSDSRSSSGFAGFLRSRVGAAIQVALLVVATFILRPSSLWFPVLIAVVSAALVWLAGDAWSDLGFSRPTERATRWVIEGAVAGILWSFVTVGILVPTLSSLFGAAAAASHTGDLPYFLVLLLYGIMQAFAKGLAYRGFLLQRLEIILGRTGVGLALAFLFATVLFGLSSWHLGRVSMLVVGAAGAVFNLLFYWSRRNVWPTILAHAMYNIALAVLIYLGQA